MPKAKAVQVVIEKLAHLAKPRLARECAKLDPEEERALAEEGPCGKHRQVARILRAEIRWADL
jgi:hypothetical protein